MDNLKALILRIFKTGSMRRVFSITRFIFMVVGFAIASVYFATDGNIFAAGGFAITTFVLYRLGQIRGYIA